MVAGLEVMLNKVKEQIQAEDPTAFDDARKLSEQYPDEPDAWRTLAYACGRKGDYPAAIAALTRAIELAPSEAVLFCIRGGYLLESVDYAGAIADFTQGLVLCDQYPDNEVREDLHFLRAEAFVQLGNNAGARADLVHVRKNFAMWTIQLRTKDELWALCTEESAKLGVVPHDTTAEKDCNVPTADRMLLLRDCDELPTSPDESETTLMTELGDAGRDAISANLLKQAGHRWLKAARVIAGAISDAGLPFSDDVVCVHLRLLMTLVECGALKGAGNLRRPRFSEVRLPEQA